MKIKTVNNLHAALERPFACPGGKPKLFVTDEGATLCPACVEDHLENIQRAIQDRLTNGWRVVSCVVEEYSCAICDECGKELC